MVKYRRLLSLSTRTDVSVSFLPQLESHWFHCEIYQQSTVRKPQVSVQLASRQVVLQRPFQNRTINVSVCIYACHILKQKIVGEEGVNICFHISTKGWAIWCLNRLRLNWNATNIYSNVNRKIISCSAPCNVCLSWGADNVQQRTVLWGNDSIRSQCISNRVFWGGWIPANKFTTPTPEVVNSDCGQ